MYLYGLIFSRRFNATSIILFKISGVVLVYNYKTHLICSISHQSLNRYNVTLTFMCIVNGNQKQIEKQMAPKVSCVDLQINCRLIN